MYFLLQLDKQLVSGSITKKCIFERKSFFYFLSCTFHGKT